MRYEWRFVMAGSVLTIVFLMVVNFLTTTYYPWFIYPSVLLLLLPLGIYSLIAKKQTLFSLVGSFVLFIVLLLENYMKTPDYPWFLYAVAPLILWPVLVLLGKRNGNMIVAVGVSILFILYYVLLNIYLAPSYPWSIFPAFVILWWPLSVYHAKRRSYFAYSIQATIFISLFFISVNLFFSPNEVWAVYPIFAVLWWPLSMFYFYRGRRV